MIPKLKYVEKIQGHQYFWLKVLDLIWLYTGQAELGGAATLCYWINVLHVYSFLRILPTYTLLFGTYTFIKFQKKCYLHNIFFILKQYFGIEKLHNKSRKHWKIILYWAACLGCCPGEVLLQKTHKLVVDFSYLHVYSVGFLPTRLLISKDYSYLHVYLVSTFIQ